MPQIKLDAQHNRVARHGAEEIVAAAAAVKLPVFRLDTQKIRSKQELLKHLAQALALPRHFGENWDALADCLMDSDWLPPSGCVLVWSGAQAFESAASEDHAILRGVFSEAAAFWKEHGKPFHVYWA